MIDHAHLSYSSCCCLNFLGRCLGGALQGTSSSEGRVRHVSAALIVSPGFHPGFTMSIHEQDASERACQSQKRRKKHDPVGCIPHKLRDN
jgi:hypothetical protein